MMNGKFGVELECFNVERSVVVGALNMAGFRATQSEYRGDNYSVWQIKQDGSIQGRNAFEVVSPILQGEDGIQEVRKVCEILTALGAEVNTSTGFHVHHDASNWGVKEFRNLMKRFVKFESGMDAIQPASRRNSNNRYIGSLYSGYSNTDINRQKQLFGAIDECRSVRQLAQLFGSRYYKLNMQCFFRTNTVEFRHHSGTVDAVKVENYIRLTYAMVQDAQDHTAVKAFSEQFTAKEALDTMLAGLVRRARLTQDVAKFYKARSVQLQGVQ